MSGQSLSKCLARAASMAAERIQSCARLIITSITSLACQTAVRPRSSCRLGAIGRTPFVVSISTLMAYGTSARFPANGPDLGTADFYQHLVERPRWRSIKDGPGAGVEPAFVTRTFEAVL
jgi:hypothetical protein